MSVSLLPIVFESDFIRFGYWLIATQSATCPPWVDVPRRTITFPTRSKTLESLFQLDNVVNLVTRYPKPFELISDAQVGRMIRIDLESPLFLELRIEHDITCV
jgi:hypothetical protein